MVNTVIYQLRIWALKNTSFNTELFHGVLYILFLLYTMSLQRFFLTSCKLRLLAMIVFLLSLLISFLSISYACSLASSFTSFLMSLLYSISRSCLGVTIPHILINCTSFSYHSQQIPTIYLCLVWLLNLV